MQWLAATFLVLSLSAPSHSASLQSGTEDASESSEKAKEQMERANPDLPWIVLGSQAGTPGVNVVIPLYYTPPRGAELRSLTVELDWVSQNMQFVRSERGIAAETIGAAVDGKVAGTYKDDKSIERSTLRVDASVVEEDPKRGIPEGLLAYLTFKILPEAKPFAIELRTKLTSATAIGKAAQKFTQAEVVNGKVEVLVPGMPAYVVCFFFNH